MGKKNITATSLANYINYVSHLKPRKSSLAFFPEEIVFRGINNKKYELTPSLGRRPAEGWLNSYLSVERDFVSQARQKFPTIFTDESLPVAKLAKLQHFGIPTRMMDVTSSALIALYFACQGSEEEDGEVFAFSSIAWPASNPVANIIADTYRLTENAETDLKNFFYRALLQDYCVSLLYPDWEKSIYNNRKKQLILKLSKPMLVESFESSVRQKNQQGKYIVFPNKVVKNEKSDEYTVTDHLVALDKDDRMIIKRITIPGSKKKEILRMLKVVGITKDFLFADNIDIVFESIKEKQRERFGKPGID